MPRGARGNARSSRRQGTFDGKRHGEIRLRVFELSQELVRRLRRAGRRRRGPAGTFRRGVYERRSTSRHGCRSEGGRVVWQRLDTVSDNGGWKYSCSVPNRQNPNIRRTYEATAGDPVAAIRAVLDQLNQEQ